jgi:hypothetical protein
LSAAASSFTVPSNEPTRDGFRARAAAIADILDDAPQAGSAAEAEQQAQAQSAPGAPGDWKSVDVDAWMPLAVQLLKLPFKKIAKVTGDDAWQLESAEEDALKVPLQNALQKAVWDVKMSAYVSNPYLSLLVAIVGVAAVKYTMMQLVTADPTANSQQENPPPQRNGFQLFRRPNGQQSPTPTRAASTEPSGVMLKSVGESLFAAPLGAVNLPNFDNGSQDASEY